MHSPDFLGPVIKHFSCSTQLSTKFQLLITTQMLKNKDFSCFQTLKCVIYHAKIVKMPTIVCILAFMSMMKFKISLVEHG